MFSLFLVALGGAIGAVLRYTMGVLVGVHVFPWATLGINILGAFAIGLIWGAHAQSDWFMQWGRLLLVVGANHALAGRERKRLDHARKVNSFCQSGAVLVQ